MKKLFIGILATVMAYTGFHIVDNLDTSVVSFKQNTLAAATAPKLSITTRTPSITIGPATIERIVTDSVFIHDTVAVTNTKYVRVPVTKHTTDTVYISALEPEMLTVDSVKNKSPGEEYTEPEVILMIDGNTVYSSKPSDEP